MSNKKKDYIEENLELSQMNRVIRHRLRNLCAGVKMTSNRIAETLKESNPRMSARCEVIVSELDNLFEFTQRMDPLFDALPPKEAKTFFDLIISLQEYFVKKFPFVNMELAGDELDITLSSGNLLYTLLWELLDNAGNAAGSDGKVKLNWSLNQDNQLVFEIENNGEIPAEIPITPPKPFYTLRSRHDGVGLAIAYRIAKELESEVIIDNSNSGFVKTIIKISPGELLNG
jgi:signal transduction histidine kinase